MRGESSVDKRGSISKLRLAILVHKILSTLVLHRSVSINIPRAGVKWFVGSIVSCTKHLISLNYIFSKQYYFFFFLTPCSFPWLLPSVSRSSAFYRQGRKSVSRYLFSLFFFFCKILKCIKLFQYFENRRWGAFLLISLAAPSIKEAVGG